jgi:hypothetical protein
MDLSPSDIERGTGMLVRELEKICDDSDEISDLPTAFEEWSLNKFAVGDKTEAMRVGGAHDIGIDFYSVHGNVFRIGQTKIPEKDWLEAHPTKIKQFGPSVVDDPRSAIAYLLDHDTKLKVNEDVRALYAQVAASIGMDDFAIEFYLIVFGKLNERARDQYQKLEQQYAADKRLRLRKFEIGDLIIDPA